MKYNEMVALLGEIREPSEDGIVIKPIPDCGNCGAGILDPRVKANRKKAMEHMKGMPLPDGFDLPAIRAAMGWPNLDVTSGAILTEHMTVNGTNGEIPVRIYKPQGGDAKPCIVFFHGGGFFGGSLDCVENPCKCISLNAECVVVSVGYRLAPEHPFPAGLNDCYDVVKDVYTSPEKYGIIKEKIGVCGDSAGGNLAAVCSVRDRNEKSGMIKYTALLYPTVDIGAHGNGLYSWNIRDYLINDDEAVTKGAIMEIGRDAGEKLLTKLYLGGDIELEKSEYVSPIFTDSARGLPPTLIITAEYDYLCIEGEAYGKFLKDAGVSVNMIRYSGMDHAFMDKLGEYPQAEDAMKEVANSWRINI